MENLQSLFYSVIDKDKENKIKEKSRKDVFYLGYFLACGVIFLSLLPYLYVMTYPDVTPLLISTVVYFLLMFLPLILSELFDPLKSINLNKRLLYLSKILIEELNELNLDNKNFVYRLYKKWQLRFLFVYLKNQFHNLKNNLLESYIAPIEHTNLLIVDRIIRITGKQFTYIISNNQQQPIINLLKSLSMTYFIKLGYVDREESSAVDDKMREILRCLQVIESIEIHNPKIGYDFQKLKSKKALIIYTSLIGISLILLSYLRINFIDDRFNSAMGIGGFILAIISIVMTKKD